MKIIFVEATIVGRPQSGKGIHGSMRPGKVYTVDDPRGKAWIKAGIAVPANASADEIEAATIDHQMRPNTSRGGAKLKRG
jgi:hypothetical protein